MAQQFRERINVPGWWWPLAGLVVVTTTIAVWVYTDLTWGLVTFAVFAVACFGGLAGFGEVIIANDQGLRVGAAHVEWDYVAGATPLDASATSRRLGPDADHAAYLAQRAYVPTAVEVTLDDPADAHPYWLVSTRRPAELARVIHAHVKEPAL